VSSIDSVASMTGGAELARQPARWLREHPFGADSILAALLTALALAIHATTTAVQDTEPAHPVTWWTVVLVVLSTLPIAFRRRNPIWTLTVVLTAQLACEGLHIRGPSWLAVLVGVYSVGAHVEGRPRLRAIGVCFAAVVLIGMVALVSDDVTLVDGIAAMGLLTAAFVLGDNLRRRRQHLESLADRAERAERERDLLARERVAEERNRIARELHDIVAHSVSVMVVQAAAARRSLATRPDEAMVMLGNVERTGRQTMDELRQVLGVLRQTDGVPSSVPVPTLDDLPALVEGGGGLPVRLAVTGSPDRVPAGIAVCVYRIVQEALTNANRHAGPAATVEVDVACGAAAIDVVVTDDGRGASASDDGGYGLVGMHERATAAGGSLSAGPRRGGGWRVRATIPFHPAGTATDTASTLVS
jgi:signal transduction histidine kinase